MKRLLIAVLAFASAGCSLVIDPGLVERYPTSADWKGTQLKVEAIDGKGQVAKTRPGMLEYEVDSAKWNPFLAKTLGDELTFRGAEDSTIAVLRVGLSRVEITQLMASDSWRGEFWIKVEGPGGTREYRGVSDSTTNAEAVRLAAAAAMKAAVEDSELRSEFAVNSK